MSDIIVKHIAYDIIAITTIWGVLNSQVFNTNYFMNIQLFDYKLKIDYYPSYTPLFGLGFSAFILSKYYK